MKLVCLVVVFVSACSTGPGIPELAIPPRRLAVIGASILPPNERGWLLAENGPYQLALAKQGPAADETYAIQVFVSKLPAFASQTEFVQLVREGQIKDTDLSRFKVILHSVESDAQQAEFCARSHTVLQDHKPQKRTNTPGHMVLEIITLTCSHPREKQVGISVVYSHRYYPESRDPILLEKARQVLDSVEFMALK